MATRPPPVISRQLLYQQMSARVRRMIREKNLWGRYLAPERNLASLFGVSRETVRRSLDLLQRQGLVARRHGQGTMVLPRQKARKRGAQRHVLAVSYMLGGGPYNTDLLLGLTDAAGKARWNLSFRNLATPAGRQEVFAALRDGGADGLLLLSVTDRALVEALLRSWNRPTVLLDHHFEGLPLTSVVDDSEGGARQAVEHLLALGHRRIGYVDVSRREMNPWRYAGYAGALRAAGLEPDASLVAASFASFDSGRAAGEELLARPDPPRAVFAFDDLRAWGVWRAAEARGLAVGRDFALVGYGDTAAQAGFPEELSSVRASGAALGRLAAEKLEELIAGRAQPGELVKVPVELVVRTSSREARAETRR